MLVAKISQLTAGGWAGWEHQDCVFTPGPQIGELVELAAKIEQLLGVRRG